MDFDLELQKGDLARQIYGRLRDAIHTGRLRDGDRLPATRELAERLDVARNTVSLAYEWLTSEGLISGRTGAGTFVRSEGAPRATRARRGAKIRIRDVWRDIRAPKSLEPVRYDFGVGSPDASQFPVDTWRRLMARQIRASRLTSVYNDAAGHPRLRAAIARSVTISRGIVANADDIIITNGAQQAFDLIARVLVDPDSRVVVEDPGYPPARLLFKSMGARVSAVPVDSSGIETKSLPDDARLAYVTPSHQFPLGMPMSHARRVELLRWAERRNAVIIEDDYDSEFRFGGRPLEPLQAIDRSGRVIYVGSFSKSLLPALRIGFLVAPPSLREALVAASYVASWSVHWPAQAALASMIEEGLLARHVRKMRRLYAARHERILEALSRDFADWLEPIPSVTGMHLAATLRSNSLTREQELARRARTQGVAFDRLSKYYAGAHRQAGLVLGYGAIATADIDTGLARLRRCFS